MPAILTHDLFGRDIYDELYETIGQSKDEFDSFLVGCQGPDVLFFSHLNPMQTSAWNVGKRMHRVDPVELLMAFRDTVSKMPDDSYGIGRSYLMGLICHYILDSNMHPFIFAQQHAIANAGIDGLDSSHGNEIHAEIESELDVLVLSTKREVTIKDFDPERNTLRLSKPATRVISRIYRNVAAKRPILQDIPDDAFSSALSTYRLVIGTLHSPTGVKRAVFGAVERMFRDHSFIQAMSHRDQLLFESDFDNRARDPWTDPWTAKVKSTSFWDIYNTSIAKTRAIISSIDVKDARDCEDIFEAMTNGLDFNGSPTRAMLLEVKDI